MNFQPKVVDYGTNCRREVKNGDIVASVDDALRS